MQEGMVLVNGKAGAKARLTEKLYQEGKGQYLLRYLINSEAGDSFEISCYQDVQRRPENFGPVRVPSGHLFAMGDNRDNSSDCRFWGPLDKRYIKGQALVTYFYFGQGGIRLDRIGRLVR